MSPQAAQMLIQEIAPRLYSTIPKSVSPVGTEDTDELCQDAITLAAQFLDQIESHGKTVTPGNIAYYALQSLRSGRRSTGCHRADVLHPACQISGRTIVISFDEPVPGAEGHEEPWMWGELRGNVAAEDPSIAAARKLDWAAFLSTLDEISRVIVKSLAEEIPLRNVAVEYGVSRSTIQSHKNRLAQTAREFWGQDVLAQVQRQPCWSDNLMAVREKMACREERKLRKLAA